MNTTAPPTTTLRAPWEIQRSVLFALMLREFRTRAGRMWTGLAWTLAEPLLHVLLIVTLFGSLRHIASPTMPFFLFLFSGLMPFLLFRSLAQRLAEAIDTNRGLFAYRQVKPIDTVIARALVEGVIWLGVLVAMVVIFVWSGLPALPARPLELAGTIAIAAATGFGMGLSVAVLANDQPRARSLVRMVYFPLYFASGVVFSIGSLPEAWQGWLLLNPLLHVVELSRHAFEPAHRMLPGVQAGYPAAFALVLVAASLALYRRDRFKLLLGS